MTGDGALLHGQTPFRGRDATVPSCKYQELGRTTTKRAGSYTVFPELKELQKRVSFHWFQNLRYCFWHSAHMGSNFALQSITLMQISPDTHMDFHGLLWNIDIHFYLDWQIFQQLHYYKVWAHTTFQSWAPLRLQKTSCHIISHHAIVLCRRTGSKQGLPITRPGRWSQDHFLRIQKIQGSIPNIGTDLKIKKFEGITLQIYALIKDNTTGWIHVVTTQEPMVGPCEQSH